MVSPQHRLVFDCGAPLMESVSVRKVFVTHGHVDHTMSMVFHASTRGLMGMSPSKFYVPWFLQAGFRTFLDAASALNEGGVSYELVPVDVGERVEVSDKRHVVPFRTDHRLLGYGYKVYETRHKLKPEYQGLPGTELGRLRTEEGVQLSDPVETLALTYVGDSRVTVLDKHPEVFQSEVLVMEATFVGDYPLVETHERGHTHLSELAERADLFKNVKTLVLTHFSLRHSDKEVKEEVAKLPESLRERVQLVF